jgi:hypothetical protein
MEVTLKAFNSMATTSVVIDLDERACASGFSVRSVQGVYGDLGKHRLALFALGSRLFLSLDGQTNEVRDQRVEAALHQDGGERRLELVLDGKAISLVYTNSPLPVSTPYYSEDEEDADFGLWLSNVLTSPQRLSTFLESWRGA